jgi:3-oxoacyl-[acyl-carrier protein] reductase
MDFTGKVVLVTGGASGIGGATTRAFADAGANVAFTYMTSAEEAGAIEAVYKLQGKQVLALKADMTKPDEVAEVVRRTEHDLGPIDILFASTGGLLKRSCCVDSTLELWQEAISLNLLSTFLVVQAALRSMEPRQSGSIIRRAESATRTPLRREGTPEDVAGTVLYLASERAGYVAGEVVQINGGVRF